MSNELTVENQLVADLAAYWTSTPPAGLQAGVSFVDFRSLSNLVLPAVIIGHDGAQRESAKGMTGTGRVALRVAVRTDIDTTTLVQHRLIVSLVDQALLALGANVLALTYIHATLRDGEASEFDDRRQQSVLSYTVVATRMQQSP